MANTLKFGKGEWATKDGSILAYNDENNNFKPLPFTFDRESTATTIGKDGLIKTVGRNEPRVDFSDSSEGAMLLEPSRTNLSEYSEDFSQSGWVKGGTTVTSNSIISPNGNLNADTLFENSENNHHFIYDGISVNEDTNYNFSIFVKKLNRRYVGLSQFYNNTRGNIAFFDLDNGSLIYTSSEGAGYSISDAKIEEYSNGWYRLSANFIAPDNYIYMGLCLANENWGDGNAYDHPYQGDVTKGVYIYGAQLEQGSYATSYIPTQGSIGTRVAESCEQTPPSGIIGQTKGVAYVEIDWKGNDEESIFGVLHDGTVNNRIDFGYSATFNSFYFNIRTSGSGQGLMQYPNPNIGKYKIAIAYKNNDFSLWINGVNEAIDSSGSVPITTKYNVGNYIGGGREYPIISSKLYNTALTDQELINLTKI